MAMANKLRLCACLLNISEARNASIVERVASSALRINRAAGNVSDQPEGASKELKSSVLNIFRDYDYNRSVITIVAGADHIGPSVFDACRTAYDLIDLRKHGGGHPRLGSVDLLPIHPLCEELTLEECGSIARGLASRITSEIPGTSAFLFGTADVPLGRGLVERRKAVKWFAGAQHSSYGGIKADVGEEPSGRYGLTGIGAIPYVMNCNVTIDTDDVEFGRHIATAIRASSPGGLLGVQSMAFSHEGKVEIACNVQAVHKTSLGELEDRSQLVCNFGNYYHVPPEVLEKRVADMAMERGITTIGTALVGFTPERAQKLATYALSTGQAEYWRQATQRQM